MILALVAVPFVLVGLFCALQIVGALGPYREVLRRPTTPVRSIVEGPVEVAGVVRAKEQPLEALDGTRATAIHTVVSYTHRSGKKTVLRPALVDEVIAVDAELVDESGACTLDAGWLVLLGETRQLSFTTDEFAEKSPRLWDRISVGGIIRVLVEQTIVAEGAKGLVSGQAEKIDTTAEPGEGYRGEHRQRFRITSTAERPLILSAFSEPVTRRLLLRPALLFALLTGLWFAVAGALVAVALWIGD